MTVHDEMGWIGLDRDEIADPSVAGIAKRIAHLERICAAERERGLAGSFAYLLPRHRAAYRLLKRERAALAALQAMKAPSSE